MKNTTRLAVLSFVLLASPGAHAAGAGSTELRVTGIIKPAACTPSLTGDGSVDYGAILASSLNMNAPNVLPEKMIAFDVICDSAIKLAVRAIDNRQSSMIPGLAASLTASSGDQYAYGLGTVGNKNIGVYSITIVQSTMAADGAAAQTLTDDAGNSGSWTKTTGGRFNSNGTERKAFTASGSVVPAAYKSVIGMLSVQVVLDKASNLPLGIEIPLDGSATLEVIYL